MRTTAFHVSLAVLVAAGPARAAAVPFPEALDRAAIEVESLSSIFEHALIIGNGDINALLWTEHGAVTLNLTKNDVWDARLDSKLDPPLPTLDLIKRFGREPTGGGNAALTPGGWTNRGADSYHAHPYPCPRACAKLVFGDAAGRRAWRPIRTQGTHNAWEASATGGVMSVAGAAGASNGYALDGLAIATGGGSRLRVRLAGSPNARYYVDLLDSQSGIVFKTGWLETPTAPGEQTWDLPTNRVVDRAILYTWTEDGQRAENHFREVAIEGAEGRTALDLGAAAIAPPRSTGRLDVRRAVATVAGPLGAEVRALADRNVFLVRAAAGSKLLPVTSADTPTAVAGEDGGVRWLTQEMPGDADWPGMRYAVAVAAAGDLHAVAIVTSREAADPRAAAVLLARATLGEAPGALVARHEAAWAAFWSRSGIRLGDTFLADAWYRNLYFLRCVTRPGAMPPGLFASLVDSAPAWHGDYHTNYNIQQTFWSAFNANQPDLAEPYARLIREYLPRARWLCRQVFGFDGAYFPHVIFAYEPADPAACRSPVGRQYIHHVWGYTMGVPAFTVQPVWWHYKYQPDRAFLEQTAYPLVRDVAVFQANFMDVCGQDAAGNLVLGPTVSPEHWGWTKDFARNRNSAFDLALFRYVFDAALEGARTLGRDAELAARWEAALKRLPAYPTTGGQEPLVVDVQDAPPITYNIAVPAVPVFPGDVVTWFSPDAEKALFTRTVERVAWNGNNSIYILGVSRARLSLPGAREWLSRELKARLRPNQTITLNRLGAHFNNFGHYTEQFGASMAIGELLLQSVGDIIRVFPAWPKEEDAAFADLRAQGGFLVTAEQAGGKVARVTIAATVGGRLRLLSPWPRVTLRTEPETRAACAPDGRGVVEVETTPGQRLHFTSGM